MGIDVERWGAEKTDQRLAAFAGEVHRQSGGRGDRSDDRNPSRERLLDDLERRASAHNQDVISERKQIVEEGAANCFVDRIMTADILPENNQVAIRSKIAAA